MFTEDLGAFFATGDFAVPAVFGALTAEVLLDAPDEELLGGEVLSTEYAIRYRAGQLTGLTRGSSITVNGINYTVRQVRATDDGALMRATLTRA